MDRIIMSDNDHSRPEQSPLLADSSVPPGPSSASAVMYRQQAPAAEQLSEHQHGGGYSARGDANSGSQHMVLRPRHRNSTHNPFARAQAYATSSDAESPRQISGSRSSAERDHSEVFGSRDSTTMNTHSTELRPHPQKAAQNHFIQAPEQADPVNHHTRIGSSEDALPRTVSSSLRASKTRSHPNSFDASAVGRGKTAVSFASATHSEEAQQTSPRFDERSSDHRKTTKAFRSSTEAALASSREISVSESDSAQGIGFAPFLQPDDPVRPSLFSSQTLLGALFSRPIRVLAVAFFCFIILDMMFAFLFNVSVAIHGPISLRPEPLVEINKLVDTIRFETHDWSDASASRYGVKPNLMTYVKQNKVSADFCEVVRMSWRRAWVKELLNEHGVCYQPDFPFEVPVETQEKQAYDPEDEEGDIYDDWQSFYDLKRASDVAAPSSACAERLLAYTLPGLSVKEMIQLDDTCLWYSRRFHAHVHKGVKEVHGAAKLAAAGLFWVDMELRGMPSEKEGNQYDDDAEMVKTELEGRNGYNLLTAYNVMEEYPLQDGELVLPEELQGVDDEFHARKDQRSEQNRNAGQESGDARESKRHVRKNAQALRPATRMWHRHRLGRILQMQSEVYNATRKNSWLDTAFKFLEQDQGILRHASIAAARLCEQVYLASTNDQTWSGMCAVDLRLISGEGRGTEDDPGAPLIMERILNATLEIRIPFEALDSQRCALSSLYAMLEGISDQPSHPLAITTSTWGRINLGYKDGSEGHPIGGRLLRLTPSQRSTSGEDAFQRCDDLSPWQNTEMALRSDNYCFQGHGTVPTQGRFTPRSARWGWIAIRTQGRLRSHVLGWIPVPRLWTKLWKAHSPFAWPDIEHVVQRVPDLSDWGSQNAIKNCVTDWTRYG